MNKTELINALAERTEITKAGAKIVLDELLNIITEEVAKGEKVQITGFGTFETREAREIKGVNPFTGKDMHVPARVVPKFKAGAAFKNALRK